MTTESMEHMSIRVRFLTRALLGLVRSLPSAGGGGGVAGAGVGVSIVGIEGTGEVAAVAGRCDVFTLSSPPGSGPTRSAANELVSPPNNSVGLNSFPEILP